MSAMWPARVSFLLLEAAWRYAVSKTTPRIAWIGTTDFLPSQRKMTHSVVSVRCIFFLLPLSPHDSRSSSAVVEAAGSQCELSAQGRGRCGRPDTFSVG